jgi:hypothetical protein
MGHWALPIVRSPFPLREIRGPTTKLRS